MTWADTFRRLWFLLRAYWTWHFCLGKVWWRVEPEIDWPAFGQQQKEHSRLLQQHYLQLSRKPGEFIEVPRGMSAREYSTDIKIMDIVAETYVPNLHGIIE